MVQRYIGLMSGTSLDGVDGVLASFDENGGLHVDAHATEGFSIVLRTEFLALNNPEGVNELHRAALASNRLAWIYARVVQDLLERTGLEARDIRAIGAHGQTVRHRPQEFDDFGYTLQLNNPALLAEQTGIDVVADFRTRDLAAHGQGAPLVPAFHQAIFGRRTGGSVAVLNLGGIANLSLLPAADGRVAGFDCAPGNVLLDHWCQSHLGKPFDAQGQWASEGTVNQQLLQRLRSDPYFSKPPPKSTGRDLFSPNWLAARLGGTNAAPQDVQATLAELTAAVCAADLHAHAPACELLIVCGGGAQNLDLLRRLAAHLPGVRVETSDLHGLPPTQVEAAAFAWLARAAIEREPGNLPSVTGARGPRILGGIYPA